MRAGSRVGQYEIERHVGSGGMGDVFRADLSPNGLWLATTLKDHGTTNLWTISTKNGFLRQVTDFQQRATLIGRQVTWSRDNKYIFAALVEMDSDVVLIEGELP